MTAQALVLDTNIVLDLWVFDDEPIAQLRTWVEQKDWPWLATLPMRIELERVLGYPAIVKSLAYRARGAGEVLARFDQLAQLRAVAPKARYTCKDPDDQVFIDLALQHRAALISKDKAVLCMKKRLLAGESIAQTAIEFIANQSTRLSVSSAA